MEQIEKLSRGQRRYKSVIEGCEMAAEFRRSGMTIAEFARQNGLSRRTVIYWCARERKLAATAEAGFVELSQDPPLKALPAPAVLPQSPNGAESSIEIRLPSGATLVVRPGFNARLLRDVIASLGGAC